MWIQSNSIKVFIFPCYVCTHFHGTVFIIFLLGVDTKLEILIVLCIVIEDVSPAEPNILAFHLEYMMYCLSGIHTIKFASITMQTFPEGQPFSIYDMIYFVTIPNGLEGRNIGIIIIGSKNSPMNTNDVTINVR